MDLLNMERSEGKEIKMSMWLPPLLNTLEDQLENSEVEHPNLVLMNFKISRHTFLHSYLQKTPSVIHSSSTLPSKCKS